MPDPRRPKPDPLRIRTLGRGGDESLAGRMDRLRAELERRQEIEAIEAKTKEVMDRIRMVYDEARRRTEEMRLGKTRLGRLRLVWRRYVERVRVTYEVIRLERRIKLARAQVVD